MFLGNSVSNHRAIFGPRKFRDCDETAVSGEYGRMLKFFNSSLNDQSGAERGVVDLGKHFTALITVVTCGNISSLFIILSRNAFLKSWLKTL